MPRTIKRGKWWRIFTYFSSLKRLLQQHCSVEKPPSVATVHRTPQWREWPSGYPNPPHTPSPICLTSLFMLWLTGVCVINWERDSSRHLKLIFNDFCTLLILQYSIMWGHTKNKNPKAQQRKNLEKGNAGEKWTVACLQCSCVISFFNFNT